MILGKKVITVLPAYNPGKLLEKTYREIPQDIVDHIILVDDASNDNTIELAKRLGIPTVIRHERNLGYGANQKTCYQEALKVGADIVIMLHPDYQYTPTLIGPMAWLVAHGTYDVALGSRILGNSTLSGGMPAYKYCANRVLTLLDNILFWQHISEYHTGYRAFTREVLETIPFMNNSNDFLFDNQTLAQIFYAGFRVGEVSCPTRYFPEASSMNFQRGIVYGLGVLQVAAQYRLQCWKLGRFKIFEGLNRNGRTRAEAMGANVKTTC